MINGSQGVNTPNPTEIGQSGQGLYPSYDSLNSLGHLCNITDSKGIYPLSGIPLLSYLYREDLVWTL